MQPCCGYVYQFSDTNKWSKIKGQNDVLCFIYYSFFSPGDGLYRSKRMEFTTKDRDNDDSTSNNLAVIENGAWWYSVGVWSNLNGRRLRGTSCQSMYWYKWTESCAGLAKSSMMMRPVRQP